MKSLIKDGSFGAKHKKAMGLNDENTANDTTDETSDAVLIRPRTRACALEEERLRKEKEAKENEPRRSNRDHDVSYKQCNLGSSNLWPLSSAALTTLAAVSVSSVFESRAVGPFTGGSRRSSSCRLRTSLGKGLAVTVAYSFVGYMVVHIFTRLTIS